MKKKILTLGMVLTLVAVLVAPNAVLAATTGVTGDVVEGYTFTAPTAIALGSMTPGTPATGDSSGWLEGNNSLGYTVTGRDVKGSDTGKMVSGANVLTDKLKMGDTAAVPNDADIETSFLATGGITDEAVPFFVSQTATYADTVATGYTITITFTVTLKT